MCLVILLLSYFSKLECSARAQPVFVRPTVRFQMQMGRTPNTLLPPLHGVTERSGAARRSSALGLNPRSNGDDNQRRRRVCAPAGDQARRARRDDAGGVHPLQGVSRARWGSGVRPLARCCIAANIPGNAPGRARTPIWCVSRPRPTPSLRSSRVAPPPRGEIEIQQRRSRPRRSPPDPPVQTNPVQVCLGCARLCTKDEAIAHARADDAHSVFADVERAELFCAPCGVHVYSRDFDRAVLGIRAVAARVEPSGENHDVSDEKRRRIATRIAARDSNPPPLVPGDATLPSVNSAGVPRGVRGIANLGNTCFLSTVLQATIRAPTVGGFFLADGHNRYLCASDRARRVAAAVARGVEPDLEDEYCLACELDELVSEAYSGSDEPMVPSEFLHAWWRQVPEHLARHRQQDAHEFFLSLVATVHSNLTPGERRSSRAGDPPRRRHLPRGSRHRRGDGDGDDGDDGYAGQHAARERGFGRRRLGHGVVRLSHASRVRRDDSIGRDVRRLRTHVDGARPDGGSVAGSPRPRLGGRARRGHCHRTGAHVRGMPPAVLSTGATGRGGIVPVREVRRRRGGQDETDVAPTRADGTDAPPQAIRPRRARRGGRRGRNRGAKNRRARRLPFRVGDGALRVLRRAAGQVRQSLGGGVGHRRRGSIRSVRRGGAQRGWTVGTTSRTCSGRGVVSMRRSSRCRADQSPRRGASVSAFYHARPAEDGRRRDGMDGWCTRRDVRA